MILNSEMEGIGKESVLAYSLRCCHRICLEELEKITKYLSQDDRFSDEIRTGIFWIIFRVNIALAKLLSAF
jgi:hypothetical protein